MFVRDPRNRIFCGRTNRGNQFKRIPVKGTASCGVCSGRPIVQAIDRHRAGGCQADHHRVWGRLYRSGRSRAQPLPKAKRSELIEAYFGTNGSSYTLCRTHIGSCDFSNTSYSYDNTPGDVELKNFSVDHDKQTLIPLIKDAKAVAGANFELLASPWTPPSWMTTKNKFVAKGNQLKPEFYKPYAEYLVKYLQAYQKEGIPITYLTMQNEVLSETATWESCEFQPAQTVDFVKILGAAFEANKIGTKILIYDCNKGLDKEGNYQAKSYVDKVYVDADAKKYIWGVGLHWYGTARATPFGDPAALHESYPDKHLIHTEACAEGGSHPLEVGVAERYGHDIIGCLNNWTEGWIDWNLVLNMEGGPNHAGNLCSAPILADGVELGAGAVLLVPAIPRSRRSHAEMKRETMRSR